MKSSLIEQAQAFAEDKLRNLPEHFVYHNLEHTQEVVYAANLIGKASNLTPDQLETVAVAAWLHDVGYVNCCENHEKLSADEAVELLKNWGATESKIEEVKRTILATTMPQKPVDILGMVLCDADLYHLSQPGLETCGVKLRQEFETIKGMKFNTDEEWIQFNLNFLRAHEYFTEYGKMILHEGKKQNIKKLKKKLKSDSSEESDEHFNSKEKLEKKIEKLKAKLEKSNRPERGIETMFRTTSENHVTLSGMADTKANIMISINTIILSIIVSVLFRKITEYPHLLAPTILLVITCLVTIVLAILATRPNIASGKFTKEDIERKKTNLLFFGNFHNMELKDYEWGMREMMKDYEYLYGSMIKDIYFLGKVLARKYKFLRLSYTVFMFGFVASVLGFLLMMLLYYQPYQIQALFSF
ncbi:MAG: DUF5706 domain-containing protein [Cyclobacteriaceae bacterium]|jgi:predicted metal-dependent HD superfamily phosphohydrolase|nr:DUF5706 domain-containing protein [Cytophagales bacterium]MCZ8328807.1 DUF5706 domain-containing protein [Cyclobacteriaceae bacterium]